MYVYYFISLVGTPLSHNHFEALYYYFCRTYTQNKNNWNKIIYRILYFTYYLYNTIN